MPAADHAAVIAANSAANKVDAIMAVEAWSARGRTFSLFHGGLGLSRRHWRNNFLNLSKTDELASVARQKTSIPKLIY
jgi:hypothetical protein